MCRRHYSKLKVLLLVLSYPFPPNYVCRLQVFVGNLDPSITEEELRQIFLQFGEISNVKIPAARGCGFVQFALRFDLTDVLLGML